MRQPRTKRRLQHCQRCGRRQFVAFPAGTAYSSGPGSGHGSFAASAYHCRIAGVSSIASTIGPDVRRKLAAIVSKRVTTGAYIASAA